MLGDGDVAFAAVVTFFVNWLVACAPHSLVTNACSKANFEQTRTMEANRA